MLEIGRNNKILLTKGDDAELQVRLYDKDGNEVEIQDDDTLTLTVKATADSSSAALTVEADGNTFYIENTDTSSMTAGLYVYDIQYTNGDTDEISTVIPLSFFEITAEVSANE